MAIFAIADLHLAVGVDKPMDVFGGDWTGYMDQIRENWLAAIAPDDTVLLPGDFCWAMTLEEAGPDFAWLAALPGRKILCKGNHDYWWQTVTKIRSWLDAAGYDFDLLHNNAFRIGNTIVCGTRGWKCPGDTGDAPDFTEADMKIYHREMERLKMSLEAGKKLAAELNGKYDTVVMLHYPPFDGRRQPSGFVELMQAYGVATCVYGHLHGRSRYSAVQGEIDGVRYHLVAADQLRFMPLKIVG